MNESMFKHKYMTKNIIKFLSEKLCFWHRKTSVKKLKILTQNVLVSVDWKAYRCAHQALLFVKDAESAVSSAYSDHIHCSSKGPIVGRRPEHSRQLNSHSLAKTFRNQWLKVTCLTESCNSNIPTPKKKNEKESEALRRRQINEVRLSVWEGERKREREKCDDSID